jgi:hypothetical protein
LGILEQATVPELPILFVSLMGLSQVTYQGIKAATPAIFSVNEVRPKKIELQEENNLITVLGSNFGSNGTVWIESYRPLTEQEKIKIGNDTEYAEEYKYDPIFVQEQFSLHQGSPREDNRIIVRLDNIKDKLKVQNYIVRVEKDGLLTYATSDALFEITSLPVRKKDLDIKLSTSKSEITVKGTSEIRADVTRKDGSYADKVQVDFTVDKPEVAELKDISTRPTDPNGLSNVVLTGKSKGTVTVKGRLKLNDEPIEDSVNIKVI